MGRKPNISKVLVLEKPPMPESTNPSLERSEPLSGSSNPSLNRMDSHLENQNYPNPALKYQNPSVEGMVSHDERSPAQEKENGKPEVQEKSSTYRRRKSKYHASAVRRSQRFKSAVACTSDHDIEPYDEDITFIDNQKDEPDTQMGKVLSEPEANLGDKGLLEKLNFILRRLEAFEKTIVSLQSKLVVENAGLDETPSSSSTVYKSMYLDSEKKLEALTDENRQLTGKLENALGKVEVLEKQSNVLIEVLEKMKDVALISGLAKSTEAAVNASTQAVRNACTASAAKRRRHAQES